MSSRKKPKKIDPDAEDPNVFLYDEVYDEMKNEEANRLGNAARSKEDKQGSKYIQGLLETAELRKTEKDIRKFKKYARDREEAESEGLLNQTDVYITPAYKKKLEEISKIDSDQQRRIDQESDHILNIHKKYGSSSTKDSSVDDLTGDIRDQELMKSPKSPVPCSSNQEREGDQELMQPRPKLETAEDRRLYLRKVLAKRTVGERFTEAVERFRQRKAASQAQI